MGMRGWRVEGWVEGDYLEVKGEGGGGGDGLCVKGEKWGLGRYKWEVMEKEN